MSEAVMSEEITGGYQNWDRPREQDLPSHSAISNIHGDVVRIRRSNYHKVSQFRCGILKITAGFVCAIIGLLELAYDDPVVKDTSGQRAIGTSLWCGLVVGTTGYLAVLASRSNNRNYGYFNILFSILSIVGGLVVVTFSATMCDAIRRAQLDALSALLTVSVIGIIMGFFVVIVALLNIWFSYKRLFPDETVNELTPALWEYDASDEVL